MKINRLFILPLTLYAFASFAEESTYLCVSEESTGFYYKNGTWGRAPFNVTNDKYILRRIKEGERGFKDKKNPYGVYELGGKNAEHRCFISKYSSNYICRVGLGEFFFSTESGRFIKTYTSGYWDGVDNNENTPNITRGRCSKI